MASTGTVAVPFFRPSITEAEVQEVVECLRSGWLTTGPRTTKFEQQFAEAVGAKHAIAVNSCTAALHLAVEALNLRAGQAVLIPTMTFAATAEVIRYQGATPILVDCDPVTGNVDLADAEQKLADLRAGKLPGSIDPELAVVGFIPVHISGLMVDIDAVKQFAAKHDLWLIDDAAHALPSAWRPDANASWQRCGENTADVSCFSFYANKTITTGEGGMAVTDNEDLAHRMRMMSLHGLSHDAWGRYSGKGNWDYQIVAPGFKYNLTDIASAIGLHQLARAEELRQQREALAQRLSEALSDIAELETPPEPANRLHSWHLFPVRLHLDKLTANRNEIMDQLKARGVGCSVHWRPLHMHQYYIETYGWQEEQLPRATALWPRLISLPLFPGMTDEEFDHVVRTVHEVIGEARR